MSDDKIILDTDPEAARFDPVGISGWVSRDGRFYGNDERLARYAGCTHRACEDCGAPTPKMYVACARCREARADKRHAEREARPWDGVGFIYSDALDRYFSDSDDLEEYLDEEDALPVESLRLLHCEPIFASEIEPGDYYHDSLPDEDDEAVPAWLEEAFAALNETIRAHRARGDALSWTPGKVAVDVASIVARPE